jgi:hypothetical protein
MPEQSTRGLAAIVRLGSGANGELCERRVRFGMGISVPKWLERTEFPTQEGRVPRDRNLYHELARTLPPSENGAQHGRLRMQGAVAGTTPPIYATSR